MVNVLSLCISHDSIDSQNFSHHPHLPFGAKPIGRCRRCGRTLSIFDGQQQSAIRFFTRTSKIYHITLISSEKKKPLYRNAPSFTLLLLTVGISHAQILIPKWLMLKIVIKRLMGKIFFQMSVEAKCWTV